MTNRLVLVDCNCWGCRVMEGTAGHRYHRWHEEIPAVLWPVTLVPFVMLWLLYLCARLLLIPRRFRT